MKIYCGSRSGLTLDNFVGKDIWVKMYCYKSEGTYYIRVLSIEGDTVNYNQVYWKYVENTDTFITDIITQEDLDRILFREYSRNRNNFEILKPFKSYSTEEIMSIFRTSSRFVGD